MSAAAPKEAIAAAVADLDTIDGSDPEMAHYDADRAIRRLLAVVAPEAGEALKRLMDRADGWWYS